MMLHICHRKEGILSSWNHLSEPNSRNHKTLQRCARCQPMGFVSPVASLGFAFNTHFISFTECKLDSP